MLLDKTQSTSRKFSEISEIWDLQKKRIVSEKSLEMSKKKASYSEENKFFSANFAS